MSVETVKVGKPTNGKANGSLERLRESISMERRLLRDSATFRANHAYRIPGQFLNPLYEKQGADE